jgi:hypothetical protein
MLLHMTAEIIRAGCFVCQAAADARVLTDCIDRNHVRHFRMTVPRRPLRTYLIYPYDVLPRPAQKWRPAHEHRSQNLTTTSHAGVDSKTAPDILGLKAQGFTAR